MKNSSKKQKFFKDNFTRKQYAAFALAFNWALRQYEKMSKTNHFRAVYQGKTNPAFSFQNLLKGLRNYFSHYDSDWPDQTLQEQSLAEELKFLVREAIAILTNRNPKLNEDENKTKEIEKKFENINESPLEFFPLRNSESIQPALALIASLFLTRSQMSFLTGKFFLKDKFKEKSQQKLLNKHQKSSFRPEKEWSSKYIAITKILETLSQRDRVLLGSDKPFISSKKEMGFAIWSRLEAVGLYNNNNEVKDKTFPEDQWFMKQLILYLEHTKALPSVEFARVTTKQNEQSNQLEQDKIFDSQRREKPLRIRHNTIEAKVKLNGTFYDTNFGIHALKYLVIADLFRQKIEINELLVKWFTENKTRKRQEQKAFGVTKDRLKKHINNLIGQYSLWGEKEIRLNEQIRFICKFLNLAWNKKYEKYMNAEEFRAIQNKVRYYRKKSLYNELENKGLLNISGISLGSNNEKTLNSFIDKDRIQAVFKDILQAHLEWLKKQEQGIDKFSDEELTALAVQLKLRNQEKKKIKDNLSMAVSGNVVREWIAGKQKRFFNYIRELSGENPLKFSYFGLKEIEYKEKKVVCGKSSNKPDNKDKKAKENWTRAGLLSLMIPKLIDREDLKVLTKKPSEQDIKEKINNKIKIKLKLTQSWRNYATWEKKKLEKLIKAYHPNFTTGELPLLDSNTGSSMEQSSKRKENGNVPQSVQSLKKEMEKERYLLMQAILEWEKISIKDININRKGGSNYISFDEILEAVNNVEDEIKQEIRALRGKCMHNGIGKKRFSEAPEPLRDIYSRLKAEEKQERKSQKKSEIQKKQKKTQN